MKIFLSLLIAFTLSANAQIYLQGKVVDHFDYGDGDLNLNGNWITAGGQSGNAGFDVSSSLGGVFKPRNSQGVGFYGAIAYNSTTTSDSLITGVVLKLNDGHAYEDPNYMFRLYFHMDGTNRSTWNGYCLELRMHNYQTTASADYRITFRKITAGAVVASANERYGPSLLTNDTLWVKTYGNNMVFLRNQDSLFSWSSTGNHPTTSYEAIEMKVDNTIPIVDEFILGHINATAATPARIHAKIVSYGTSITQIDTGKTFRVFGTFHSDDGIDSTYLLVDSGGVSTVTFKKSKNLSASGTPTDTTVFTDSLKLHQGYYGITPYIKSDSGFTTTGSRISFTVGVAKKYWNTVYYMDRHMGTTGQAFFLLSPWDIEYTNLTHIVTFFHTENVNPNVVPYNTLVTNPNDSSDAVSDGIGQPGNGNHPAYLDSLTTIAHRSGVRVIANIQAVNAAVLNPIADDSVKTDVLIKSVIGWAERHHEDGVEVNWESWQTPITNAANATRFIRRLRFWMDNFHGAGVPFATGDGRPPELLMAPQSGHQSVYYAAELNKYVNQINMQEYDLDGFPAAWGNSPLYKKQGSAAEFNGMNERGPRQWVSAGYDPKILGLGLAAYHTSYWSVPGGLYSAAASEDKGTGFNGMGWPRNFPQAISAGLTQYWDNEAKMNYMFGQLNQPYGGAPQGAWLWMQGPTPRQIDTIAVWLNTYGFGGMMLYDIMTSYVPNNAAGQRFPLANEIGMTLNGAGGASYPGPILLATPANGATNVELTAVNLKSHTASNANNYAMSVSRNGNFSSIDFTETRNDTSFIVAGNLGQSLLPSTVYYWRVIASNQAGSSTSPTYIFTTKSITSTVPAIPTLLTPTNHATGTTTPFSMVWMKVDSAYSGYTLRYGTDTTGSGGALTIVSIPTDTFYLVNSGLSSNTKYFWHVRSSNASGSSSYSAYFDFTTPAVAAPLATIPLQQFQTKSRLSPKQHFEELPYLQLIPWSSLSAMTAADSARYTIGVSADGSQIYIKGKTGNGTAIGASNFDASAYQQRSEKGQAAGYASLDGSGRVPLAQLPTPLISDSTKASAPIAASKVVVPAGAVNGQGLRIVGGVAAFSDVGSFSSIRASTYPSLTDSAVIAPGSGTTITQAGRTITITANAGTMTGKAIQDSLNARSDTITTSWYHTDTDANHPWRLMYNNAGTLSEQMRIYANNGTANIQGRAGGGVTIGDNNSGNFLNVGATPGVTMIGTSSWRMKSGRNFATERDTQWVWSDSSAFNRTNFAVGSRGTISMKDTTAVGIGVFTTTAQVCTLTVQQAAVTDNYLLTPIGTTVTSNDVLSAESITTGVIVHRPASGTSGLSFFYMRIRRK